MKTRSINIKNTLYLLCLFILLYCQLPTDSLADELPSVKSGDRFPNIPLVGLSPGDKKYLGLSKLKEPSLSNIRVDYLCIDVLSIYCSICQKHANKFNRLYHLIQKDNSVVKNMEMIGIAIGNNTNEVAHFRKYFSVSFPVVPDPDFKVYRALNKTRTPLLIIVDKRKLPYNILTVLDFIKEPEILMNDIRAVLHRIK